MAASRVTVKTIDGFATLLASILAVVALYAPAPDEVILPENPTRPATPVPNEGATRGRPATDASNGVAGSLPSGQALRLMVAREALRKMVGMVPMVVEAQLSAQAVRDQHTSVDAPLDRQSPSTTEVETVATLFAALAVGGFWDVALNELSKLYAGEWTALYASRWPQGVPPMRSPYTPDVVLAGLQAAACKLGGPAWKVECLGVGSSTTHVTPTLLLRECLYAPSCANSAATNTWLDNIIREHCPTWAGTSEE